ncbi:hypothetical protein NPIL_379641 [Nephila pilipes]|uniref:Reverse transcriptase n=1 Tax=Nephila pilipes TaxID=299642 RepID=A0A8X6J0I2_NEPPI|nr:hypothetical protein NPIL_379641 [Nephila pilipes]
MIGLNVSRFLSSTTIKHHIKKYREQYSLAPQMLDICLYGDDVISGAEDINNALEMSKDVDAVTKKACWNLRKWNKNDKIMVKL